MKSNIVVYVDEIPRINKVSSSSSSSSSLSLSLSLCEFDFPSSARFRRVLRWCRNRGVGFTDKIKPDGNGMVIQFSVQVM